MTQWLLDNSFVALNTMYRKTQKQTTYLTPKKVEKQLDYILTDIPGAETRKPTMQYTWGVITDVLWPSSKFRRTKENLVATRRQRVTEKERRAKMVMIRNTETSSRKEPGTSRESTTKEATDANAKAKEQKPEADEDASPVA